VTVFQGLAYVYAGAYVVGVGESDTDT